MKEVAARWGRRLLWVLPILFVVYLLVGLADFVWYRSRVPIGFQNANWSGHWETKVYGGLTGRLVVRLPDPLPEDEDFPVEALVYYPIYSFWKTGQFVKMDFNGRFTPGDPVSGGQNTRAIPSSGVLKFKGTIGEQSVEYAAVVDDGRTRIVGGYVSHDPNDYGLFMIRYY